MSVEILGKRIDTVGIVDDSEDMRNTISDDLQDADFIPRPFEGQYSNIQSLMGEVVGSADAVICDHHLKPRNYASFSGAELAANLYQVKFPFVLVTRWTSAVIEQIRFYRRHIPALVSPDNVSTETIIDSFQMCLEEFGDSFRPTRKPWSAVVRVEDITDAKPDKLVSITISAWNPNQVINIRLDTIPSSLQDKVHPGARFFAKVNIGAETQEELYLEDFEYR